MSLVLQRMLLASRRMSLVNLVMAMIANADAKAAVVMTKAPVNQRMLLVHQRSRRMPLVNLVMAMIANADARVAREAENLEKMKPPQKHQKTLLSFDETFAKAVDVVVMTALVHRKIS